MTVFIAFALALALPSTARAARAPATLQPVGMTLPNIKDKAATLNGISEAKIFGGYETCYVVDLVVVGTTLSVAVDAGSTDLAVASVGLNNYDSSAGALSISRPANAPSASGHYGDTSWWSGYGVKSTVSLRNTLVTANNAPFAVITSQSSSPIFVPGAGTPNQQGLLGLAYPALSQFSFTPASVVDAWYASGTMKNNVVAFHGCPYDKIDDAYIDFGYDTPSKECNPSGEPIAWAQCPTKSYFTIDIRNIYVNDIVTALPSAFQTKEPNLYGGDIKAWSIIDSCSTLVRLPSSSVDALRNAIKASGALPSQMTSTQISNFLSSYASYTIKNLLKWDALPTLSFDIVSDKVTNGTNQIMRVVLGGRQYIQCDPDGYCMFLVGVGGNTFATLGIPVYSNLLIILDRANGRVGFAPGCGCTTATDGYPKVLYTSDVVDSKKTTPNSARPKPLPSYPLIATVIIVNLFFWML